MTAAGSSGCERVAMFRGTFTAQPTPTGFRVTAHLPVDEAVAAS